MCNKGITQFLPATHARTIVSVLPRRKATALWPGTKLYCLVTEATLGVRNLPRVFTPWCPAETRTCDLFIASPTLYSNTTTPSLGYGWGATGEYRLKIGDFAPTRSVWPKTSGRRGRPHQPFFFLRKRLNDLSYGIKIWTDFYPVLSQFTRLIDRQTDRRTDGQTPYSSLVSAGIWCSAEKNWHNFVCVQLDSVKSLSQYSWLSMFLTLCSV